AAASNDTTLALVAYSTPKEAFAKIIPAFQATPAGRGISFTQSYGPSGDQAQAIVAGLPADVVDLSLAPDVETLVKARLVAKNWDQTPYHGIVTRSVVVFVVRQGTPKHIKDWGDLVKPGVAVLNTSKDKAAAQAFMKFLYSPTAQKLFGETGYRPVLRSALKVFNYPVRPWLFTIGYVGGWDKVDKQFFDPNTSVMAKIERGL